uniref:Uncharacterized protein n=1 Tax=Rhizophora mucronata TaxID=61149 RepID=A0A2P2PEC0_RHIMU
MDTISPEKEEEGNRGREKGREKESMTYRYSSALLKITRKEKEVRPWEDGQSWFNPFLHHFFTTIFLTCFPLYF